MDSKFIKLAKEMREAQKEAPHSQKAQRRARSLEQLFDVKLEAIEKEMARAQEFSGTGEKPAELPLFGRNG
jgi:hypothetical protein